MKSFAQKIFLFLTVFSITFGFLRFGGQNSFYSLMDVKNTYAASKQITCAGQTISQVEGPPAADQFNSGDDVTLVGNGTCFLNGAVTPGSLIIGDGTSTTVLSHAANTNAKTNYIDINTGNVTIMQNAKIDVNGRGYSSENGPGAGSRGTSGSWRGGGGGAYGGNGGQTSSVAGNGSGYGSITAPNELGSGGGSGESGTAGASGGGLVKINASGTILVDGSITANGNAAPNVGYGTAGGGAGGGIFLTAGTLDGGGILSANGGNGGDDIYDYGDGGGGGGGRIALVYNTDDSTFATLSAYPGTGPGTATHGGAGTIYKKAAAQTYGELILNSNNSAGEHTPISGISQIDIFTIQNSASVDLNANLTIPSTALTFHNLNLDAVLTAGNLTSLTVSNTFSHSIDFTHSGLTSLTVNTYNQTNALSLSALETFNVNGNYTQGAVVSMPALTAFNINAGTTTLYSPNDYDFGKPALVIEADATLTHASNTTAKTNYIDLTVASLNVKATGEINVNAKGYSQQNGSGAGSRGTTGSYPGGGGGAYGGNGGQTSSTGGAGTAYGSDTSPNDFGSGGGNGQSGGGATGGGFVKIIASGSITVNGSITANGNNAGDVRYGSGGGGAGGGILLFADSFAGGGTLIANGGDGGNDSDNYGDGGGGGGGRIAQGYINNSSVNTSVLGGIGPDAATDGGVGTAALYQLTVPSTPSISSPANGIGQQSRNPTLNSNSYSSNGALHLDSDWRVTTNSASCTTDVVWQADGKTGNGRTQITVNATDGNFVGALTGQSQLTKYTTYYSCVRHRNGKGYSNWSSTGHAFTTLYSGTSTSQIWDFNEADPGAAYDFISTNIEINAGSNGRAQLKDLGNGTYKSLGVDGNLKKKVLTITNPGAELANYQIKLSIPYDSDMQADFDDLRFANAQGTKLNYWIESKTDSVTATVWVKVDTIAANPASTTLNLYYGNSALSSESSIGNTFIANQLYGQSGTTSGQTLDSVNAANTIRNLSANLTSGSATKVDWGSFHDGTNFNTSTRDSFYQRFRFIFAPSTSGDWHFALDSDDGSQLILSPGDLNDPSSTYVFVNDHYGAHGVSGGSGNNTERNGYSAVNFASGAAKWMDVVMSEQGGGEALRMYAKAPGGSYQIFNTSNFANQIYARQYTANEPTIKWEDENSSALNGWTKRTSYSVYNSGPELTDYQIKINVTYDSDMQADFDDLRFTAPDGTTLLNHWLESKDDSDSAVVWVKIPTLVASGNTTIYMYYGNSGAVSASNMDSTFIFADDFNDGTIDTNKWQDTTGFTESGGYLNGGNTTNRIRSVNSFTGNYILETRHYVTTEASNGHQAAGFWASTSNAFNLLLYPTNNPYTRNDGSWANHAFTYMSNWVKYRITAAGANSKVYYYNEGTAGSGTFSHSNSGLSSEYIALGKRGDDAFTGESYNANWDWLFVRKYVATEPQVSQAGAETSAGVQSDVRISVKEIGGVHPAYTKLLSFSETRTLTQNQGNTYYQLSNNGTNWYWNNSGTWQGVQDDSLHRNTATEVNNYISKFVTDIGTGQLYFKVFLISDGTQPIEIENVTLAYDAGVPINLSNLAIQSTTATSATLTWTAPQEPAFNHYEIWYGKDQTKVENKDTSNPNGAAKWDQVSDANLAALDTNDPGNGPRTTITGLETGATYYFRIWAVDNFGQSADNGVTISANTNQAPVLTNFTVTQKKDGTADAPLTFTVSDGDGNPLSVKAEYSLNNGGTWSKMNLGTTSTDVTAVYGNPAVNNSNEYQLSSITSSSGANTLTVNWPMMADLKLSLPANVKLKLTPYDGIMAGNAVIIDKGLLTTIQCADGIDNDGDGFIDSNDLGCDDQSDDQESGEVIPSGGGGGAGSRAGTGGSEGGIRGVISDAVNSESGSEGGSEGSEGGQGEGREVRLPTAEDITTREISKVIQSKQHNVCFGLTGGECRSLSRVIKEKVTQILTRTGLISREEEEKGEVTPLLSRTEELRGSAPEDRAPRLSEKSPAPPSGVTEVPALPPVTVVVSRALTSSEVVDIIPQAKGQLTSKGPNLHQTKEPLKISKVLSYDAKRPLRFTDIGRFNPLYKVVTILKNTYLDVLGQKQYVLNGDLESFKPDGTAEIRLNEPVTRLEWATILMTSHGLPIYSLEQLPKVNHHGKPMPAFTDLPKQGSKEGALPNVAYSAAYYGLLSGSEGKAELNRDIKVAEAVKMLMAVKELAKGEAAEKAEQWVHIGIPRDQWYFDYYAKAAKEGVFESLINDPERTGAVLLRKEAIEALFNALIKRKMYTESQIISFFTGF